MATLIDDATATDYFNGIDNAPEDQRQQMADDLLAWGKAKKAQEYNDTDDHFSKLFTDEAYFEQEKQANAAVQESLDPDQTAKSAAIGAWLEHRNGRPIDPLTYQVERDAYAMANYGKKNLDDSQLFDFISGEYNTQKKKTEAINDLQMQAVGKAITDSQLGQIRPFVDGMTEVFNQWQGKYPELVDGKNDAAFLSQGYKLYYDTINDLDTVRPQASKALSTLTSFTQGNATDEDMQSLANDFVGAPPEDRQKIYKYVTLAAQAGQIDRAGIEQFAVNMGQAFTRGFDFVPQGTLQMQEAGVNSWLESIRNGTQIWVPAEGDLTKAVVGNAPAGAESDAWRQASVPETETLIQSGQNVRESFKVVRELRNVAKTGVDPIRPVLEENSFWGTAERGAYGLAGSIPLMGATAVNPYLGVLAYQATEYDRIMLENPDVDPQFAQGLALVEGAANAAIDRVQLKSLSGKLPMFGRYLDRIASDGVRRTVKIGANVVEQNLQEGAQDLIAPVLETAVASLREDMPDKDFTSLMDEWAGQRAETFFATLPLALIGGGIATYQDIKNPSAELNATRLRQVGFDKEQTTFIQRAENPEEYDARIQMEWDKRTPENIEAGRQEVIAEMEQAATPDENSAKLSETVAEDGTRRWTVTTPDGKELLQTQDQQAALDAIAQHGNAQILNKQFETAYEPVELRQMITDLSTQWTSQDSNNTLVMESQGMNAQQKLEQLQAAGNAAQIQELHNRIANSPIKDTPYDQINILGEASVDDVAEMVFKPLITINPNTRPENLREEIHHIGVKVAIKNGSVTLDTLRGWLDETEKALPGTFQNLVRDSEGDIVESLSQVQAAYENGKINADEETKLPPSFINYIKNMMRTLAEVMRRAVALRGAFKDGALPAEYESFLADSVGLNQQARVDTASSRVSKDIITDGGQTLMDFSIGSRTSAVSTDTPSIRASNATLTGPANYSIAAHHGTPHKVDKFSTEKIGTGEGAQAYGWGLYFAQNQKVADDYRDGLSETEYWEGNNKLSGNRAWAALFLENNNRNPNSALLQARETIVNENAFNEVSKAISDIDVKNLQVKGGNLYTVELDVDDADLLDWDKPLSEQSPKVQAAIKAATADIWKSDKSEYDGSVVYNGLVEDLRNFDKNTAEKMASERLLAAGIPGIRYLDGGSRSEGQGTYNYVAFDENLIRITEENGNRIPASQALAAPATGATNYSIGGNYSSEEKYNQIVTEISSVNPNKVSRRDMYEVAKVSPDVASNMSFEKPIEVSLFADGTLMLSDGHHRLAAAKQLGMNSIPAVVRSINAKGNHINALIAEQQPGATNYSIGFAPNGKPSNLNPEEQALARSPEFKARLGDWEILSKQVQQKLLGENAVSTLLAQKSGEIVAMNRPGLGDITFLYGTPGKINKKGRLVGGGGLSHLIEQRNLEGNNGIAVAKMMPSVIAHGRVVERQSPETTGERVKIVYQNHTAILSRYQDGKPFSWLLTGWENEEGGAGVNPAAAYASAPSGISEQMGASIDIDPLNSQVVNPESVMVKTDENGEPLSSEIARFRQETGTSSYSIASQSEIDRVNKALGGMNRGPDERLKVYQRAKQKFSKLMAWNSDKLAAMAETGSDETQIRRTQILQGLGELDGIMSVLPPEVRGRVGGYTKLAGIAPHDVLKDGVKVSEVSGMNGAIISAWMREGQNIGQAGKQVSLPPGYTATENLSTKRADKAIADFLRDRIKKIDTELEKVLVREYTEAITKAVKQSRPKAGDNGVRKSTLGAETQKFADMVQRATLLDDEATPKRMAEIEAALTNPDATAEDISALSEEWSILNTFGDLDNRSSETLAQGLDWLKGQLQMGREAWRIKEQARIDEQRARAAATIEWLGKGTAKKRFADKGLMQRIAEVGNNYLLDHASFEQFVTAMLPPEIAANFSERLRKADMAAQSSEIRDGKGILDAVREGAKAANMSAGDAMLWLKGDQKNAVAYLEGRKVKDERIAIELAQKIVTGEADRSKLTDTDIETLRNELAALPADTQKEFVTIKRVIFRGEDVKLDMSRAKAIQLLLSWSQPDVQIKMRKEGWTDESATDLKALVNDPVSRSVVSYLQSLYGKGAGIVNPVYSRMFGMTMPQVKNYAPTRFLNAKDSKDIGLDGSPTATGTTPGFAKSRVTHSAKIAPEDALTVAQGHIAQQAHWVHFAELAREFRALLSSPDVRESLKQAHGDAVLKSAELWADQLEQRGGNKAREAAWLNPILGTVLSGKAVSSLGFSLKTLAMQLDNTIRFGLALDMRQIVSALSNPSTITEDIQTVWESDAIQNRLQGGATAEARFLFSRYAGKPNFGAKIAEASMTPINWLDSAATSISSAIVYRANLNDALAAGMPENLAKQAALDAASQAIYRFAQPVSFGQKSIMENNGNVLAKTFFLFMSDPRLKTAILADAARGLATGQGNANEHIRRILVVETMAVLSHVVASAFRDVFSDDDDEEIWNLGGFAKAILLAPLQGFFFAGTVGELAISKLTGQKTFNSSTQNPLLSAMEQAVRAGNNLDDVFNLDDPDAMLKEWNNIFRSMALSPAMAAPAVLLNMIKPVVGLYQNAATED